MVGDRWLGLRLLSVYFPSLCTYRELTKSLTQPGCRWQCEERKRKQKGGKKKRGDQEMAMKQRKGYGTCNPKFQQKTMQKERALRWKWNARKDENGDSKRPSLSMWLQQRRHTAASVTQIKDRSSQKTMQRANPSFSLTCLTVRVKLSILVAK